MTQTLHSRVTRAELMFSWFEVGPVDDPQGLMGAFEKGGPHQPTCSGR